MRKYLVLRFLQFLAIVFIANSLTFLVPRLVPGDPYSALSHVANTLTETDLLVISSGHDPETLARAWFFVPRMLTDRTSVFVEQTGQSEEVSRFVRVSRVEIERLAKASKARRVA